MPLIVLQGALAFPDVLLNLFFLSGLIAVCLGMRKGSLVWWVIAGIFAGLGWLVHYRFAVPVFAMAVFFLLTSQGRSYLTKPGPWLMAGLSLLGLVTLVGLNLMQDFSGIEFQLVDRHPWHFQWSGFLWLPEQMLITGPVLFVLMVIAGWKTMLHPVNESSQETEQDVDRLLATTGIVILIIYVVIGLWADRDRTLFHWPLPAYLALLPLVSGLLWRWWQRRQSALKRIMLVLCTWLTPMLLGVSGLLIWLDIAQNPQRELAKGDFFPDNHVGWPQVAQAANLYLQTGDQLIADNFMLAAELGFELDRVDVLSLDHPLNVKHGRSDQLVWWQLHESAIQAGPAVLVVESNATPFLNRPAHLRRLCKKFPELVFQQELSLYGGRKRFLIYRGHINSSVIQNNKHCDVPSVSYLDFPVRDALTDSPLMISGWAFDDDNGVREVWAEFDSGLKVQLMYGLPKPGVLGVFKGSTDSAHPNVGFTYRMPESLLAPGEHQLTLQVISNNGQIRHLKPVYFTLRD